MRRILTFGNSGSGKTTMARDLSRRHGIAHLDLDQLAWAEPAVRKPTRRGEQKVWWADPE